MSYRVTILEPHRQPAHDPAADCVPQGVFLVLVVQGIEDGHRDFGRPEIAGHRFLLPELITAPEVEQIVTADSIVRRNDAERGKILKERCDRIRGRPIVMV